MLTVREVSDPHALPALEAEWRSLCSRSQGLTPFQTWDWTASFLRHAPSGRPLVLRALDSTRGDEPVGLLPLRIERYYGTPLRRVRFLTAPLSDYQDQIALPGREAECRDAFLAYLLGQRRRWDLIDLADLREGTALAGLTAPPGLHLRSTVHRLCPYIPLPASWEALVAGLGKNLRANVGRRRRQLAKQFRLELSLATEADLEAGLEDLFRLHNQRWQKRGASGAFHSEAMQRFHRDAAAGLLRSGHLRLHLVRLDGKTAAAFYCFQMGERVYYYLSGFDPELGRFSLGTVAMSEALQAAIREGVREFDLLRGDETYKYEWQARDRRTLRLLLWHDSLRSRCAWHGSRLERTVEHLGLRVQRRLWGRKKPARGGPPQNKKGPPPAEPAAEDSPG